MTDDIRNFIGGQWVAATGTVETAIVDPTRESVIGLVRHAEASDVEDAVRSASLNGAPQNFMAPFGGCKRSGFGRGNGRFGVKGFLQLKAVHGAD